MAINTDLARACLLQLTNKDPIILETHLSALLRLLPPAGDLSPLHDEALVPRVCHVLTSMATGAFKPTASIAGMTMLILERAARDEEPWQLYLARELTSKVILSTLKSVHPNQSFLIPAFSLLLLLARYEKTVSLIARLEGGIEVLVGALSTHGCDDHTVCTLALRLLHTYCKSNENNVALVVRRGGVAVLEKLLVAYSRDLDTAALCVDALTLCCKIEPGRKLVEELNLCPALTSSLLARLQHFLDSGDLVGYGQSPLVSSTLSLLQLLCVSPASAEAVWYAGGFVALWALVRDVNTPPPVFKAASAVIWRVLTGQTPPVLYPGSPYVSPGPGGLDLNACRLWRNSSFIPSTAPAPSPAAPDGPRSSTKATTVIPPSSELRMSVTDPSAPVSRANSGPLPSDHSRTARLRHANTYSGGRDGSLSDLAGDSPRSLPSPREAGGGIPRSHSGTELSGGYPVGPAGVGFRAKLLGASAARKSAGIEGTEDRLFGVTPVLFRSALSNRSTPAPPSLQAGEEGSEREEENGEDTAVGAGDIDDCDEGSMVEGGVGTELEEGDDVDGEDEVEEEEHGEGGEEEAEEEVERENAALLRPVSSFPQLRSAKAGEKGAAVPIRGPHSVIEQATLEAGMADATGNPTGGKQPIGIAYSRRLLSFRPAEVQPAEQQAPVPEPRPVVEKGKGEIDRSFVKNKRVTGLPQYDWKEQPHWFPEFQCGVPCAPERTPVPPSPRSTPDTSTADAALSSSLPAAGKPSPIFTSSTSTSLPSGGEGPVLLSIVPVPPPPGAGERGVGGVRGRLSPRVRDPTRVSVTTAPFEPPASPTRTSPSPSPPALSVSVSPSHQLTQREACVRALARPPFLPLVCGPAPITSTRPFLLPSSATPSLPHSSLPPPLPEPLSLLPPEDREALFSSFLSRSLRCVAGEYIERAEQAINIAKAVTIPWNIPNGPPAVHFGTPVYDVYTGIGCDAARPYPPLPYPKPVPSHVLDSYFEKPAAESVPDSVPEPPQCTCGTATSIPPLAFESRFESGNLRSAVRVSPTDYELLLEPDTNTLGHTQWFYFRVTGMLDGVPYTLSIVNLEKPASLFNQGMRPLVYASPSGPETKRVGVRLSSCPLCSPSSPPFPSSPCVPGEGWRRCASRVCYYPNKYSKLPNASGLYSLYAQHSEDSLGMPLDDEGGSEDDDGGGGGSGSASLCADLARSPEAFPGGHQGTLLWPAASPPAQQQLYSESWSIVFPPGTRTAFFAYCHPYTMTDLALDIGRWDARCGKVEQGLAVAVEDPNLPDTPAVLAAPDPDQPAPGGPPAPKQRSVPHTLGAVVTTNVMIRSALCRSLGGNILPLLTITDFTANNDAIAQLPYIVLSARVHPGETNASWMMRGVIDFLTSSDPVAALLRTLAVFKIVPFLNPDGVINGHHRTGLCGVDLNRHWTSPDSTVTPSVACLKQLLSTLVTNGKNVAMFCDFHGHSRRKNIFMFGCDNESGTPERVFPKLIDTKCESFAYRNCSFKVTKSKVNCARVAVWRDLGVTCSYTIEASFAGADEGVHAHTHFSPPHYQQLGHGFCRSMLDLLEWNAEVQSAIAELKTLHPTKYGQPKAPKQGRGKSRGRSKTGGGKGRSGSVGASLPPQAGPAPPTKPPAKRLSGSKPSSGSAPVTRRSASVKSRSKKGSPKSGSGKKTARAK